MTTTLHAKKKTRGRRASGPSRRKDPRFVWATGSAHVESWRALLRTWVAGRRGTGSAVQAGNLMLDYVLAHPTDTTTPTQHCNSLHAPAVPLAVWLDERQPHVFSRIALHDFFAWYIDTHLSTVTRDGRVVPNGVFVNPLPRPYRPLPESETARAALPTHYIRKLVALLTDNDWDWAQAAKEDWFVWRNPDTGQDERVWSPVRAYALAVLLLLPLRSFQVRVLDSGEGDDEVRAAGVWQKNAGLHAPKRGQHRRQGFVRRFPASKSGREVTGFFINTNKTSQAMPGTQDPGYAMPWEHHEAIAIADNLAQWQRRHNPTDGPSRWVDVADVVGQPSGMGRQGAVYFLFRDPLNCDPRLPVTYGALNGLWGKLMQALEAKLDAEGQRCIDGSPLSLTQEGRSLYDMHSLRVSHITALANEGKVPLHILSKHVAGHASLVMTAHYIKTDPDHIDRVLSEASVLTVSEAKSAFMRQFASRTWDEKMFVSNDAAGMAALAQNTAGLWRAMPTGFCPVGASRCGDGGPMISKGRHAPVPGGALNCHNCRFHITGPAFLLGLVARFNATSFSLASASEELAEAERALQDVENRHFKRAQAGEPPNTVELADAQTRHENAAVRIEVEMQNRRALYVLVEEVKRVARTPSAGTDLILPGSLRDMETAVKESKQVELWDVVCQGARFYEAPHLKEAVLLRGQAFDRMLAKGGGVPVFFRLHWREALVAGNQMMTLMARHVGRAEAVRWLDDERVEVESEVAALLQQLAHASSTGLQRVSAEVKA